MATPRKKPEDKLPPGRPSTFTEAKGNEICERLIKGESLRAICQSEDMPDNVTILRWLRDFPEFDKQYTRARQMQALWWSEELMEIADDGRNDYYEDDDGRKRTDHDVIARSKLRIDTRKWMLSKMLPKIYGDKTTTELSGPDGGPIPVSSTIDVSKLDADERATLRALIVKAKGEG